jgi:glycosyltransferase involved in cell wall biosynthesis
MERKQTIGVCIIAKNEEVLIRRALESVKGADQIVVIDTGSTDKTVEIAREYTNEVYLDFVWVDHMAEAFNHGLSKMKTDWILSVDCDEYLHDMDEVRRVIELGKKYIACEMIAEGDQKLGFRFSRLFRNDPNIFWVQPIHKHLNLPGEGEHIGNVRITFGYSPAHHNDPNRTLRILQQAVAEEGDKAGRNLYYLGREYWYKMMYKDAVQTLGRYVQVSKWPAEKSEAFLIMSQAYHAQQKVADARDACLQAINLNANFKEALEFMAQISSPDDAKQWKRMARTANNKGVLWNRSQEHPNKDIIFLSIHNDDETLFGAYTLMRLRPLVVVVTDSYIQPLRGDIGCSAEERRQETINAMRILGCPVVFLGIKDTELSLELLRERLNGLQAETVYIPDIQGGNVQHDMVGAVGLELFGRANIERYTTYTKTEPHTEGRYEVQPTIAEMELKNKALDCYKSQIALPSTKIYFDANRNKSEWLM